MEINNIAHEFLVPEDPDIIKINKRVQQLLEKVSSQQKEERNLKRIKLEKRLKEIGKMAEKFGMLLLHDDVLLGIFSDIAKEINNKEKLSEWKKKGEHWKLEYESKTKPSDMQED